MVRMSLVPTSTTTFLFFLVTATTTIIPKRSFILSYNHHHYHHLSSYYNLLSSTTTVTKNSIFPGRSNNNNNNNNNSNTRRTSRPSLSLSSSSSSSGGSHNNNQQRKYHHRFSLLRQQQQQSLFSPSSTSPSDITVGCRMSSSSIDSNDCTNDDDKNNNSKMIVTTTLSDFLQSVKESVMRNKNDIDDDDDNVILYDDEKTSKDTTQNKLPHLVMGNPAGDADSIISAIGLAYVDALLSAAASSTTTTTTVTTTNTTTTATIPIVSIPLHDLKTQRPETKFLLHDCAGLTKDLDDYLIAIDDQHGLLPHRATLTLVDHNYLYRPTMSNNNSSDSNVDTNSKNNNNNIRMDGWIVTEIVDHHMDEMEHLQTCPPGPLRTIAFDENSQTATVASTCTLIVERFYNHNHSNSNNGDDDEKDSGGTLSTDITMPPSLAIILLGVILLDSINMLPEAGKGTARDRDAIQNLLDRTDWTQPISSSSSSLPVEIMDTNLHRPDPTKFFDCLQSQKFSPEFWKGLTTLQALRLDYKSFPISASTSINLGGNNNNDDDDYNVVDDGNVVPASTSFGISTILLDMDTFLNTKQDIEKTLYNEIKEKHILLLGLMFTFMEEKNRDDYDDDDEQHGGNNNNDDATEHPTQLRRQLAIACTDKDLLDQVMSYLFNDPYAKSALELDQDGMVESKVVVDVGGEIQGDGTSDNYNSTIYIVRMNQGNVASSRKQIAPVLMGFWKR